MWPDPPVIREGPWDGEYWDRPHDVEIYIPRRPFKITVERLDGSIIDWPHTHYKDYATARWRAEDFREWDWIFEIRITVRVNGRHLLVERVHPFICDTYYEVVRNTVVA